jgi:hypothetical protein
MRGGSVGARRRSSVNRRSRAFGLSTTAITCWAVATVANLRMPTSTPTTEEGSATPGCWGREAASFTAATILVPRRESVTETMRARPLVTRRSILRVFSCVRTVPSPGSLR